MPDDTFVKAGKKGAILRWGKNRGPSKQVRVLAETADRIHRELIEKDRVVVLSQIINEGLDRLKK